MQRLSMIYRELFTNISFEELITPHTINPGDWSPRAYATEGGGPRRVEDMRIDRGAREVQVARQFRTAGGRVDSPERASDGDKQVHQDRLGTSELWQ